MAPEINVEADLEEIEALKMDRDLFWWPYKKHSWCFDNFQIMVISSRNFLPPETKCLIWEFLVNKLWSLTDARRIESTYKTTQFSFLILFDDKKSLAGLTTVFIKNNCTRVSDSGLNHSAQFYLIVINTNRLTLVLTASYHLSQPWIRQKARRKGIEVRRNRRRRIVKSVYNASFEYVNPLFTGVNFSQQIHLLELFVFFALRTH